MSWQGWKHCCISHFAVEIENTQPRYGSWAAVRCNPDVPLPMELCNLERDSSPQAVVHPWAPVPVPYDRTCSLAPSAHGPPLPLLQLSPSGLFLIMLWNTAYHLLRSLYWHNFQLLCSYSTFTLRLPAQPFGQVFRATLQITLMVFLPAIGSHLPLGWSQGCLPQCQSCGKSLSTFCFCPT